MAAGDFSASLMYDVQEKMESMFSGPKTNYGLNKPIPVAIAGANNQQVNLNPVMVDNTCVAVDVTFLKDTISVTDTGTIPADCTIAGNQGESAKIQLVDTDLIYTEFSIYDDQCKDTYEFVEKTAYMMARAKVEMELTINNKFITFFESNAMASLNIDTDEGTLVGDEIQVPKATLNDPDYIGTIHTIAAKNKFGDANTFIVSGQTFYKTQYNAQFRSQSCCTLDAAVTDGPFDMTFDLINMDSLLAKQALLVVDSGAYVFWPKNQYANTAPINQQDQFNTWSWVEPSNRLTYRNGGQTVPVMFDVLRQRKCVKTGENVRWGNHFRLTLRMGFALSPDPYTLGSGIMQFVAV